MPETSTQALNQAKPPQRRRGRKPVLTIEKIDKVCNFIRVGNYLKTAVAACGIRERTWYASLERAEKAKRPTSLQRHLMQSVTEAEAQGEAIHVQRLFDSDDPRISLEVLARRFPERWAATHKNVNTNANRNVDGEGNDVQPGVLVIPGPMDEDAWEAAAARYKDVQPRVEEPADDDES